MTAVILDIDIQFEVAPVVQADGTLGAPDRLTITLRPCWRKPPERYELKYVYEDGAIAYYQAVDRQIPGLR